jgi:glycosyltransferase involved in cell wall biosynthesis
MPLAVLEAFAAGLPVVGTDLGGVPELIDPGVDGRIVPANDPRALAESLVALRDDPEGTAAMGAAARAKAERAYAPGLHLERLRQAYAEAAAGVGAR